MPTAIVRTVTFDQTRAPRRKSVAAWPKRNAKRFKGCKPGRTARYELAVLARRGVRTVI